jgi:hypothetical protein
MYTLMLQLTAGSGRETMNAFADELLRRITAARQTLRTAQEDGDLDAERIYAGELDSLLHLARENGVSVDVDMPHDAT